MESDAAKTEKVSGNQKNQICRTEERSVTARVREAATPDWSQDQTFDLRLSVGLKGLQALVSFNVSVMKSVLGWRKRVQGGGKDAWNGIG